MRMRHGLVLLLLLWLPFPLLAQGFDLAERGRQLGLDDPLAFATTVEHVCRDRRLPDRYVTKEEARRLGWEPGQDLCRVAPGRAIGGDRFANRERLLPEAPGRVWYEADLDYACGPRGPRRLVFSSDGLVFVSVDHYRSFCLVPCPQP
ncbi:Ribonuclease [bacterium HR40]|nr:Ribonuclease [bacterium HR40]